MPRARAGKIKKFTGVSDPYEEPVNPDIVVCTDSETIDESFSNIMELLDKKRII